jgi:hypothetical protein
MHSWAAINHKLAYKKEEDVPSQFKRTLYTLSALIELADNQFDMLRKQREEYGESLVSTEADGEKVFDASVPLTFDSLQSLLSFHCPKRETDTTHTSLLLDEMREVGISLKQLDEGFRMIAEHLDEIESDYFKALASYGPTGPSENDRWNTLGSARTVLEIVNDSYWDKAVEVNKEGPFGLVIPIITKWREFFGTDKEQTESKD